MDPNTTDIASNILLNVVTALGTNWDRRLSDADRDLIRACCDDAAKLGVMALATPRTRDAQVELLRERAQIHAQLCSCFALGAGRVADAFWEGFRATVNGAVTIAFAAM